MKYSHVLRLSLIYLLGILFFTPSFAQDGGGKSSSAPGDLIWADEFEGEGIPDASKWERLEYNRRNNENGPDGWWSNEDSFLDGEGNLVITVRQIENKNEDADTCDFSVGMVRSKHLFEQLYGKFEVRCRLPQQPGWWVAFWMMQGNVGSEANAGVDGTEVDIMEGFGWTDRIQHALHWDGYGDAHESIGKPVVSNGIREGFHTYGLEWYPEMYVFYVDGEETWRSTGGGVCNQPGYIKVTGEIYTVDWAIGSGWANHPADATYPDSFIIDYVRVYEIGDYEWAAGIRDVEGDPGLQVIQDQVNRQMMLKWDASSFSNEPGLKIYNASGQLVKSLAAITPQTFYSMNDLHPEFYVLSLSDGKRVMQQKIVIQ